MQRPHAFIPGAMRGVKVPATILSNAVRLLLLAISGKNVLLLDEWPMCASPQRCIPPLQLMPLQLPGRLCRVHRGCNTRLHRARLRAKAAAPVLSLRAALDDRCGFFEGHQGVHVLQGLCVLCSQRPAAAANDDISLCTPAVRNCFEMREGLRSWGGA